MLEGQNRNWHEVINDRRVQYTNLAPGPYRFRVMASNNSGVWNETGDTLSFSIAPAYYQTRWFAALLVIATAALLWEAHRLRIAHIARQFNRTRSTRGRASGRASRATCTTRCCRAFEGLLLRFQSAMNLLPVASRGSERPAGEGARSGRSGDYRGAQCRAGTTCLGDDDE